MSSLYKWARNLKSIRLAIEQKNRISKILNKPQHSNGKFNLQRLFDKFNELFLNQSTETLTLTVFISWNFVFVSVI